MGVHHCGCRSRTPADASRNCGAMYDSWRASQCPPPAPPVSWSAVLTSRFFVDVNPGLLQHSGLFFLYTCAGEIRAGGILRRQWQKIELRMVDRLFWSGGSITRICREGQSLTSLAASFF